VQQRQGVPQRALRHSNNHWQHRGLERDLLVPQDAFEAFHQHVGRDGTEVEALHARENRRRQLAWVGRGQDEDDVRRRLLERLQQRIERVGRQLMALVADVGLLAAAVARPARRPPRTSAAATSVRAPDTSAGTPHGSTPRCGTPRTHHSPPSVHAGLTLRYSGTPRTHRSPPSVHAGLALRYTVAVHPPSIEPSCDLPVETAPARYSHGTREGRLTVAPFRAWRGSTIHVAWGPAFNAARRGSLNTARPRAGIRPP